MSASSLVDVCRFNPTAGGTTDWTYSSAVTGYQSPSAAGVVNGAQYSYRAESSDLSQWEIGQGTYNTGTGVLARTTVLFNSSGTTSKINFSAAPQVAIVALSEDLQYHHDSASKAWGYATISGGVLTNRKVYNMDVARTGTGTYTATMTTAFDSANYAVVILASKSASILFPAITSQTSTVVSFSVYIAPGFTASDADNLSVVCFGRQ
jgi:hypothetical protein